MNLNFELPNILSEHLAGMQSCSNISTETISFANCHQVSPIVYYQTKEKKLVSAYYHAIHSYSQRKVFLTQIESVLEKIPYYIVKGLSVSRYYPIPQLRTMGDCDIVVHEADKEKVKQLLLSIGFDCVEIDQDCAEWHFQKQGLEFELHHRLLYDHIENTEKEKDFTDSAWNHVNNHELDPNFHFVFLLIHLKKHFLHRGVGLRQFMDLAVMSRSANLNPEIVCCFLKQIELEKFAGICSALCLRWFGIGLPVETPSISDVFFNDATEMILSNGVFGFENKAEYEKVLLNSVNRYGKVKSVLFKFFPSYKGCSTMRKYKWIKGKPYLLPVLWIFRPFEFLLSGRVKEGVQHIKKIATIDEAVTERNRILAEWGL